MHSETIATNMCLCASTVAHDILVLIALSSKEGLG